jgi:hypothetical protein
MSSSRFGILLLIHDVHFQKLKGHRENVLCSASQGSSRVRQVCWLFHLQFSFLFRSTDPLLAFSEIQWPSRECLVKRQVKRLSLPATAAQIFETLIVVLVVRDSYSVPIRRRI